MSHGRICNKAGPAVYPRLSEVLALVPVSFRLLVGEMRAGPEFAIRQVPPSTRAYSEVLALFQASTPLLLGEM